jgi:2-C-methyl-D-erythritol 4-phosphate cytidylyltransferase
VKAQLVAVAAGSGSRLGAGIPKALVRLQGVPLLVHALRRFEPLDILHDAVIVCPSSYEEPFARIASEAFPDADFTVTPGGAERRDSVREGLKRLEASTDIVVIHDAARPFIDPKHAAATIDAAQRWGAATVALPCSDTILMSDSIGFMAPTPDRRRMWACQTPQTFKAGLIRRAHQMARLQGVEATDDATLAQRAGNQVKLIEGSPQNLKITTPVDMAIAETLLEKGLV